ncbi:Oxidoreductase, aldo/keto reductase family protein [Dirofilaria immitis]|nr:Oxidoreductase, aldo/keto reductase family protein [Dirofilaria immitis]
MTKCGTVKLATGADLPLFGLGTWLSSDRAALTASLRTALDAGYPLIDTAYIHRNEAVIGQLPSTAHKPFEVEEMVKNSSKICKLITLTFILSTAHVLANDAADKYKLLLEDGHVVPELVDHLETWKVLEKLHKEGILKAIGLSNFNEEQIQNILDHATVKPHNLQVEAHIYWPQKELHEFCKKNNITMTSYATLGSPGRIASIPHFHWPAGEPMKDPLVLQLAEKYKKSPAQILLRHMIQRGICVIPKSINPDRVIENFSIFDFKLTEEEIDQLDNVKTRVRLILIDVLFDHPWYPFKDVDLPKMKRIFLAVNKIGFTANRKWLCYINGIRDKNAISIEIVVTCVVGKESDDNIDQFWRLKLIGIQNQSNEDDNDGRNKSNTEKILRSQRSSNELFVSFFPTAKTSIKRYSSMIKTRLQSTEDARLVWVAEDIPWSRAV